VVSAVEDVDESNDEVETLAPAEGMDIAPAVGVVAPVPSPVAVIATVEIVAAPVAVAAAIEITGAPVAVAATVEVVVVPVAVVGTAETLGAPVAIVAAVEIIGAPVAVVEVTGTASIWVGIWALGLNTGAPTLSSPLGTVVSWPSAVSTWGLLGVCSVRPTCNVESLVLRIAKSLFG
jgi:hypothetical protein